MCCFDFNLFFFVFLSQEEGTLPPPHPLFMQRHAIYLSLSVLFLQIIISVFLFLLQHPPTPCVSVCQENGGRWSWPHTHTHTHTHTCLACLHIRQHTPPTYLHILHIYTPSLQPCTCIPPLANTTLRVCALPLRICVTPLVCTLEQKAVTTRREPEGGRGRIVLWISFGV